MSKQSLAENLCKSLAKTSPYKTLVAALEHDCPSVHEACSIKIMDLITDGAVAAVSQGENTKSFMDQIKTYAKLYLPVFYERVWAE